MPSFGRGMKRCSRIFGLSRWGMAVVVSLLVIWHFGVNNRTTVKWQARDRIDLSGMANVEAGFGNNFEDALALRAIKREERVTSFNKQSNDTIPTTLGSMHVKRSQPQRDNQTSPRDSADSQSTQTKRPSKTNSKEKDSIGIRSETLKEEPPSRRTPALPASRKPSSWSWPQHMTQVCQRHNITWSRETLNVKTFQSIFVDEKHKVLFCAIPKVGCTTWLRVFLALNGKLNASEAFTSPSRIIHGMWGEVKYLNEFPKEKALHILDNYFKVIMVRNPFERLVSAYRNKLEPGAGFFHFGFNKPIVEQYRKNGTLSGQGDVASFEEFVDYLVDPKRKIKMNNHWEQYNVICDPCIVKYDYVAYMSNMDQDSSFVLNKLGRTDIKIPNRQAVGYLHKKTSSKMQQYVSTVPQSTLESLYRKYSLDFELFNFTKFVP